MLKVTKTDANHSSFQYTFGKYMVSVSCVAGTKSWCLGVYTESQSYMSYDYSCKMSHVETAKLYGLITSETSDYSPEVYKRLSAQSYSILFGLFPSLMSDDTLHFDDGHVELYGDMFNHEPVEFYAEPSTEWTKIFRIRRNGYRDRYFPSDAVMRACVDRETFSSIMHFVALGYNIA